MSDKPEEDQPRWLSAWTGAASKVKISGGLVGKLSWVMVFAVLSIGAIGVRIGVPWVGLVAMILIVVIVLLVSWWTIRYADRHPWTSGMEGAELVQYGAMVHQGMKGHPVLPVDPDRKTTPMPEKVPLLIDSKAGESNG